MSNFSISDLPPAGSDLFSESEGFHEFMKDLTEDELKGIEGGGKKNKGGFFFGSKGSKGFKTSRFKSSRFKPSRSKSSRFKPSKLKPSKGGFFFPHPYGFFPHNCRPVH